ncbi:MAG: hypothetical protein FJX25_12875 [Alphaproteobacteria bacterium]|nr:hypothetical protein [Alphaproteobacteria bacterium]
MTRARPQTSSGRSVLRGKLPAGQERAADPHGGVGHAAARRGGDRRRGGTIPPTIEAALHDLPDELFPPKTQMIGRIKWRSDTVISRVNPVNPPAAVVLGATEDQLGKIFGVQTAG